MRAQGWPSLLAEPHPRMQLPSLRLQHSITSERQEAYALPICTLPCSERIAETCGRHADTSAVEPYVLHYQSIDTHGHGDQRAEDTPRAGGGRARIPAQPRQR